MKGRKVPKRKVAGNHEPYLVGKAIQWRFNHCGMQCRCIAKGWLDTSDAQMEARLRSVMRFVWAIQVIYINGNSMWAPFPPENKPQRSATAKTIS